MENPHMPNCGSCGSLMRAVKLQDWFSNNLLLSQLQKLLNAGRIRLYQCPQCGKIEMYR